MIEPFDRIYFMPHDSNESVVFLRSVSLQLMCDDGDSFLVLVAKCELDFLSWTWGLLRWT